MTAVHSPRYQQFLTRLRAARVEAGLTQVEVARRLRKPQSFVSKCESGERRVDAIEFADLAQMYGRTMEMLVNTEVERTARR